QAKGRILVNAPAASEDRMMELAIEAGADDCIKPEEPAEEPWTILCAVSAFQTVKEAIEKAGQSVPKGETFAIAEAEIAMVPNDVVEVTGDNAETLTELMDAIEDLDDVQKVYTNAG
ncbi:MAG: YebC/PmpR family DNA-binding transcriptional regulator, partial [Planctomycetes bacterium]|nr:YebC/PmpR family DNA-binding transcriptional regulator [Planctomycetota bacterium]